MLDGGAVNGAVSLVSEAIDANAQAHDYNLMFAGEAMTEGMEAAAAAQENALEFGAGAMQEALQAQAAAAERAAQATSDSYEFSAGAVNRSFSALETAMELQEDTQSNLFEWSAGAQQASYDMLQDQTELIAQVAGQAATLATDASQQAANNMTANAKYAMDQVQTANRSETAGMMDKFMIGAFVVLGLLAWRNA